MATITGSSTIDWSSVPLDPINVQQDFDEFSSRFDQVVMEIDQGLFHFNSPPTSTFISLTLDSGGILTARGSGFGTPDTVVKSFNYHNPLTGDVLSFRGTLDLAGNGVFNSLKVGFPGFQVTIIGNIVVDPLGNSSGSVTQLKETLGSATVTIEGSLVVSGNFDISGTVTQISVLSGTNKILMSGLSLPFDALDSVTTANDLFAVVGNQLTGNDTITYTNNSSVGMTFFGGGGNDTITIKGPKGDTLNGGTGNDILTGGLGQDIVNGDAGDDRITMLVTAGNVDTINAGDDTDTLVLSGLVPGNHVVVVDLSSSTDQVVSIGGVPDALTQINVENLTASGIGSSVNVTGSDGDNIIIGSNRNDSIDGGAGNDTLNGGAGNDTLDGGADNDSLIGGTGNDSYTVDSASDVVTEALTAGTDKVFSSIDYTLTANVENLELTSSADIDATGNALANVLTGNSGVNVLTGGAGNDSYIVQNDADSVVENLNAGIELVQSSAANFTLGANVEKLTLTGSADINGTGNTLNNILAGNSGNNTLSSDAGNDRLIGGAGNDTLNGDAGNDILIGGEGNDNLDGGAGTNKMVGGLGDDTYTVDLATDVVTEALNAGTDTVLASLNYRLGANVENLELTGNDNLNGIGNALANVTTGNSGNNTLFGLAGSDQLDGGDGNDTLLGGLGQDTVTGGAGDDRITMLVTAGNVDAIDAGDDNDTLVLRGVVPGNHVVVVDLSSSTDQVVSIGGTLDDTRAQINFENLNASGIGSSVNVIGSAGANSIIGSKGNDSIESGAGNDTLTGGAGGDTLDGGTGNDTLIGGTGNDNLQGGADDDLFLLASTAHFAAAEVVDGGDGTDTLRYTGNAAATLTLTNLVTNIERVEIANAAGDPTGIAAINVNAAAVANGLTIIGNNGANVLTGTSQADTLTGNGGNDTLRGGLGDDTYQVNPGDGQDRISENDSTLGNSDTLLYGATINPLDLVLSRQANDLRIALHGTAERITIQNWYSAPTTAQVETIQAGNGQTLLNTQVDQLIQAMATFTQNTGLSWDQGIDQQPAQVQGILAASWQ
jgi:Ca2+-binding RTX toxin-like protein